MPVIYFMDPALPESQVQVFDHPVAIVILNGGRSRALDQVSIEVVLPGIDGRKGVLIHLEISRFGQRRVHEVDPRIRTT